MQLSLKGAQTVVITDHRQLLGFMQRKNVQGRISQGRLLSFFKAMNLATLTEYAKECMLWGVTLGPHELVHLPFNAVVAESVSATTIGLRWACLPAPSFATFLSDALDAKIFDASAVASSQPPGTVASSSSAALPSHITVAAAELKFLKAIKVAVDATSLPPPPPPLPPPAAATTGVPAQ